MDRQPVRCLYYRMMNESRMFPITDEQIVDTLRAEIEKVDPSRTNRIIEKFVLAVLSSIPWIGGVLSAAESFRAEESTNRQNYLQTQWLEEHQRKLYELAMTLQKIQVRFDTLGQHIDERIQSEEYLALVRKAFRIWDQSDTAEKKKLLANVIVNAASTRACADDVIRLFLDWIGLYNEVHFAVIREIFQNQGSTRFDIWTGLYGELPREDSSAADLYKFLFRDLSTGGVIRQERDVNALGQFVRKRVKHVRRGMAASTLESAFDDTKPYVLTAMGREFVHYTMNELVSRIEADSSSSIP